jgi:hypothetical protein
MHNKILHFISTIRESFIGSEIVYTRGSCYYFFSILSAVFDTAECYYDLDHIISKIENKYYDITGEVTLGRHLPFTPTKDDVWIKEPYNIFKKKHPLD